MMDNQVWVKRVSPEQLRAIVLNWFLTDHTWVISNAVGGRFYGSGGDHPRETHHAIEIKWLEENGYLTKEENDKCTWWLLTEKGSDARLIHFL